MRVKKTREEMGRNESFLRSHAHRRAMIRTTHKSMRDLRCAGRCWRRQHAPRAVKARAPIHRVHQVDANGAARGRCVHELPIANVDADMRMSASEGVEEHEIARAQLLRTDRYTACGHLFRRTWQL